MAQLLVRGLDRELVRRLRIRAAQNGRSAEAEHRDILATALRVPDDFWNRARQLREETRGRPRTDSSRLLRRNAATAERE
jgi:plasmid stability protein